jgi:hypothetical protein
MVTILIDQSENDYLERIHLHLDRSGKELLDIVLLNPTTPTECLRYYIMEHGDRFKSLFCFWTSFLPFLLKWSPSKPMLNS